MTRRALLLSALVLIPSSTNAKSPLDGVWRITQVVTTGANAVTITNPQPGLVIFAQGHYSWMSANGEKPRTASPAPKDPASLTDAEKLARYEEWTPFTANSGTYSTEGSTLTRHVLVAKNVNVMTAATPQVQSFEIEGDTLYIIQRSAPGQPVSETRTKFTRVR